jgi:molecular chaperone GrpE
LEATRQDRGVGIETYPENDEQQFEEEGQWRDLALRLQAEMDNYRKRQRRLAQHQIWEERLRLLGAFLPVVDDLERALQAASAGEKPGLRRGVELTHRSAMQVLANEGVESISAEGQPFDPNLHEAVSTFPQSGRGVAPDTVIRVLEPGYRLGDRLLRPAKVVVAV